MKLSRTNKPKVTTFLPLLFVLGILLMPSRGDTQPCSATVVNSSGTTTFFSASTIQAALDHSSSATAGRAILVSGVCNENVVIGLTRPRITLDGQGGANGAGGAEVSGPDATKPTILIQAASSITVRGFASIRGGGGGIGVTSGASATIVNNTVEFTGGNGVLIGEKSSARLGWVAQSDPAPSPNLIRNNVGSGILLTQRATARLVGNTIQDNGLDGIQVTGVSHADVAGNLIDHNDRDGISVSLNSNVTLGDTTEGGLFSSVNNTTGGSENISFGVRCSVNSSVSAKLGSLNGISGRVQLDGSCVSESVDMADIDFAGGVTSGTIVDNGGWNVAVSELVNPMRIRVDISGAGSRAATFDMCPAADVERVFLDSSGEIAEINCANSTDTTEPPYAATHVFAVAGQIEIRTPPSNPGYFVTTAELNGVTLGSPIVPDPTNTQPIGVSLVDATDSEVAFFALDKTDTVNVTPPAPDSTSTTSNVTVLTGSVTMELTGQDSTAILNAGASVDLQSNGTTGATELTVSEESTGSVAVVVDGQPVPINPGQTFSEPVVVAIDIQPGTYPNLINSKSGGGTPVAILSSTTLDARTIDPLTVTLAGAPVKLQSKNTPMASFKDVNGDGLLDLVVHVDTSKLQLTTSSTQAVLVGFSFDKTTTISGIDSVAVVH